MLIFIVFMLGQPVICDEKFVKVESPDAALSSRAIFLDAILVDYNNKVPPNYENEIPCEVAVHLYINNVDSIDESTMDFTLGMIIHQSWQDSRLDFAGVIKDEVLELDNKLMEKVWVPDLFIANEKRASVHDITVPNRMMHLHRNGRITYKLRISLTAQCPMDLQRYPLDTQVCSLIIKSFSYTKRNLKFVWNEKGVITNSKIVLPQFKMTNQILSDCDDVTENANFTCLRVDFYLERMIGFCLLQVYIPTTLIVMLSWISFWLSCDAVPARTSLGILTVLTMTTQSSTAASTLPKVSYIKALDTWMASCLTFVFASMIEFAIVNVLARRTLRNNVCQDVEKVPEHKSETPYVETNCCCQKNCIVPVYYVDPYGREKAQTVDRISRVIFPVIFFLFCFIYWSIYTL